MTVKKHLKAVHQLSEADVGPLMADIQSVMAECSQCGKWFSNLSKHLKSCRVVLPPAPAPIPQAVQTLPKAFKVGGEVFLPMFRDFLESCLAMGSVMKYFNSTKVPSEQHINNFKIDKLLYALETHTYVPPLTAYLKENDHPSKVANTKNGANMKIVWQSKQHS